MHYLVDHQLAISCPLVKVDDFVRHCSDRGLDVSKYRLEQLERLGILYPLARGRHFMWKEKYAPIGDGDQFTSVGELAPGEEWDGPVVPREWHLTWGSHHRPHLAAYLAEGRLWAPSAGGFQPWDTMVGEEGNRDTENFYSVFQLYTLYFLERVSADRRVLRVEDVSTCTVDQQERLGVSLGEWADGQIQRCRDIAARVEKVAWLCQLISNRYYPSTQSDRRTIRVSGWGGLPFDEEDWDDYRRQWADEGLARKILEDLNLRIEDVGKMLDDVRFEAHLADPLDDWYTFVSFINIDEKQRLKGSAQLGQHLYAMEGVLRLFYEELTGREIPRPHEDGPWLKQLYGPSAPDDVFTLLEGLANHFHVNPRPRLSLIVEGESEETAIPWLAEELLGMSFSTLQIQVVNFHGIDNITGRKREAGLGLSQLIDFQHRQNTIVYCIVDKEGSAEKAVRRLLETPSVLDGTRKVTKTDYVRVWEKNIEFDNFTCEEIARGLTDVAAGRAVFDPSEVTHCAGQKDSGSALKSLYQDKTGGGLPKPKLLRTLFEYLVENRDQELSAEPRRPIVQTVIDIANYAAHNYPPVGPDVRQKNLESGLFG